MQPTGDSAHLGTFASSEFRSPGVGAVAPVCTAGNTAGRPRALPWPEDLLISFSLRMASHGMSISRIDMLGNPKYALAQLAHARGMGDSGLSLLAEELFRCYALSQAGIEAVSH